MDTRTCKKCGLKKPFSQFPVSGRRTDGSVWRRHTCAKCYYLHNNRAYVRRVKQWYMKLKRTLTCQRCGFSDFRAIEFHHLRDKVFNVSDAVLHGTSIRRLKEEIAKCVPLCANYHRILTYQAHNSEEECRLDKPEVEGANPSGPT